MQVLPYLTLTLFSFLSFIYFLFLSKMTKSDVCMLQHSTVCPMNGTIQFGVTRFIRVDFGVWDLGSIRQDTPTVIIRVTIEGVNTLTRSIFAIGVTSGEEFVTQCARHPQVEIKICLASFTLAVSGRILNYIKESFVCFILLKRILTSAFYFQSIKV